jgi:hypothetical protein
MTPAQQRRYDELLELAALKLCAAMLGDQAYLSSIREALGPALEEALRLRGGLVEHRFIEAQARTVLEHLIERVFAVVADRIVPLVSAESPDLADRVRVAICDSLRRALTLVGGAWPTLQ